MEAKKLDIKKYKWHLIIGGTILLFLIFFGIYFYRKGKKQVSIQTLPGALPGDPSGTSMYGASNDEIKITAQQMYQDMDGFNWAGHDLEPYKRALNMNDGDLIKLYNTFNTLYQVESGQTLTQWIENEKFTGYQLIDTLLQRFAKLNLK